MSTPLFSHNPSRLGPNVEADCSDQLVSTLPPNSLLSRLLIYSTWRPGPLSIGRRRPTVIPPPHCPRNRNMTPQMMVCTLAVTQALNKHRKNSALSPYRQCNSKTETTSTDSLWGRFGVFIFLFVFVCVFCDCASDTWTGEHGLVLRLLTVVFETGKSALDSFFNFWWVFFCNKVKAGTTPAALSFLAVCCTCKPRGLAVHLFWWAGTPLVRQPPPIAPDDWARWVLLLRSTMNVYSISTSLDLWYICRRLSVSRCRVELNPGGCGRRVENHLELSSDVVFSPPGVRRWRGGGGGVPVRGPVATCGSR